MSLAKSNLEWAPWVLSRTGADAVRGAELLQNLWSGYGQLLRLTLDGGDHPSVILKRVVPPKLASESVSDRRKRQSYDVEQTWYRHGAQRCDHDCRVARCLGWEKQDHTSLLLLEDLQSAGFRPHRRPGDSHLRAGLSWLANFHSRFLTDRPEGLWDQGSYWHLGTRQEEWTMMPAGPLKDFAAPVDRRLRGACYQTLVHGDSKPANFLWSTDGTAAAVDFQYVGTGCGMRDVSYFLDCCLGESGCEQHAEEWLDVYFASLRKAMQADGHGNQAADLETEWRELYPVAWTDFCRFYQGWSASFGISSYSQRQLERTLALL